MKALQHKLFSEFLRQQKDTLPPQASHLEFHLLSFLRVDSHNVLVVPQSVSAVLLLCSHVAFQSLQHALRLDVKRERKRSVKHGTATFILCQKCEILNPLRIITRVCVA